MEDFKDDPSADFSSFDQHSPSNIVRGENLQNTGRGTSNEAGCKSQGEVPRISSAGGQESGEVQICSFEDGELKSPESGCQEEVPGFKDDGKPQNASKASLKISKGMTEKKNMWISGVVAVVCLIVTLIIYVSSSMGAVAMSALVSIVTSFGLYTFIIYGVIYFLIKLFSQKK